MTLLTLQINLKVENRSSLILSVILNNKLQKKMLKQCDIKEHINIAVNRSEMEEKVLKNENKNNFYRDIVM